jgi:hypothetical protein
MSRVKFQVEGAFYVIRLQARAQQAQLWEKPDGPKIVLSILM